jgi:hypothetical protein
VEKTRKRGEESSAVERNEKRKEETNPLMPEDSGSRTEHQKATVTVMTL